MSRHNVAMSASFTYPGLKEMRSGPGFWSWGSTAQHSINSIDGDGPGQQVARQAGEEMGSTTCAGEARPGMIRGMKL